MSRIITKLKSIRARRQKGSIMALTAVMITGLLGMLALSIDVGFIFSLRNQYQNGIDAAALAAASALRVTIEGDASAPRQKLLAEQQAKLFASFNDLHRYALPDEDKEESNRNGIVIDAGNVTVEPTANNGLPQVKVDATVPVPTLFAGIFGFESMQIRGQATASIFPVDGGTGSISAGTALSGGGWRPLMLPDTFYDSSGVPQILYQDVNGIPRVPDQTGDYYRSRFAAGARAALPFVDPVSASGPVTGLRDTPLTSEIGSKTVMGMQVRFRWDSYFVPDFSSLPRSTPDPPTIREYARVGYGGLIRVGDSFTVFPRADTAKAQEVRGGLEGLFTNTIGYDTPSPDEESFYHYVVSSGYPGPNTHGAIIPVLFYDPFLFDDSPATLTVTNIGLFLLNKIEPDGSINGYFVREIFGGGAPIAPGNMQADSDPLFRKTWLPMAVQLLR